MVIIHLTEQPSQELVLFLEGGEGSGNFGHFGDSPNVGGSGPAQYPSHEEFEQKVGELKIGDIFSIYNKAKQRVGNQFDAGHLNRALGVLQKGWTMTKDGTFTSDHGWKATAKGCNCPDATKRGVKWCKHRLARAIVVKFWQNYLRAKKNG